MCLNCHRITFDPSKLAGLHDWPCTSGNIKEVWKVLNILRYQHPFILNFASFACSLTNLLKKDMPSNEPQMDPRMLLGPRHTHRHHYLITSTHHS